MKPGGKYQAKRVLKQPFSMRKLLAGLMLVALIFTFVPAPLFASAEGIGTVERTLQSLAGTVEEEHWYIGPDGQVPLEEMAGKDIVIPVNGAMPRFQLDYAFDIGQDKIESNGISIGQSYSLPLPDGLEWLADSNSSIPFYVTEVDLIPPANNALATPSPLPEATPSPLPEATPSPLPEATPSPLPEATPSPLPEATPSPLPEATASPLPEATPSPLPEATPSPVPEAIPSPLPEVSGLPLPEPPPTPAAPMTYHIPRMLLPLSDMPNMLGKTQIGTITFDKGNAILTFDYTDAIFAGTEVQSHEEVVAGYLDSIAEGIQDCTIKLTAELSKSVFDTAQENKVSVTLFGTSILFKQEVAKPVESPAMDKTGSWTGDKNVEWNVTITPKGGNIAEDCIFTDVMLHQYFVEGSFKVNGVEKTPTVSVDGDTTTLHYTFAGTLGEHTKDNKIVITYKSKASAEYINSVINDTQAKQFLLQNQATLTAGENGPQFDELTVSKTLSQNKPELIFKEAAVGSASDIIRWTVRIDNAKYTLHHVILTDYMGPGLDLINTENNPVMVGNKKLSEYKWSYQPPEGEKGAVLIIELGTVTGPLKITYDTKITNPDIAKGDVKADNRAEITFDYGGFGTGNGEPGKGTVTVDKSFQIQDASLLKTGKLLLDENKVAWTLTINPNKVPMQDANLYEELDWGSPKNASNPLRQHFDLDSFKLTVDGVVHPYTALESGQTEFLVNGTTVTSQWGTFPQNASFNLNIGDLADGKTLVLTFTTTIDENFRDWYTYNSSKTLELPNGATLKFKPTMKDYPHVYAKLSVTGNVLTKAYGKDYNATTGEMTWSLNVNANKLAMPDAKIVDTLPKGMTYVDGSASYKVDGAGSPIPIAQVLDETTDGQHVLTFDLGGAADKHTIAITYKAKLNINEICWDIDEDGKKILLTQTPELINSAQLVREGYDKLEKTTATANFPSIKVTPLTKSGIVDENNGNIHYSVVINPSKLALEEQFTNTKFNYVEDRMGYGLQLDVDSVTLEKGTVDSKNTFVSAGTVDKSAYTVEYTPEYKASVLKVTLPQEEASTTCYRLSYDTDVVLKEGTYSLNNSVSLNGMQSVIASNNQKFVVSTGTASGLLSRMTLINLRKVDAADTTKGLSGAQFNVYTPGGQFLGSGISDDNGALQIKVRPNESGFVIKEVTAPDGYDISEAWKEGIAIKGGAKGVYNWADNDSIPDATVTNSVLTVSNAALTGMIRLVKTDMQGKPLEGAVFGLLPTDVAFDETSPLLVTSTSGKDGLVHFENVAAGSYHIKEITAPTNCEPIETEILVSVNSQGVASALTWSDTKEELNRQATSGLQIVENQVILGTIQVTKVAAGDAEKKGLSGAEFTLLDKEGQVVRTAVAVDENGFLEFSNLLMGTYILHETKAPTGYELGKDQEVVLNNDATLVALYVENVKTELPVQPTPTPVEPTPTPAQPTPAPEEPVPTPATFPGDNDNDNGGNDRPVPPAQRLPDGGVQGEITPDDPEYFIDDNEIPRGKGDIPDPIYWIDDNGIPLGYQDEDGDWVTLEDGDIPLGAMTPTGWVTFAPQTGDSAPTWIVTFLVLSAVAVGMTGFAVYQGVKRVRRSRDEGPEGRA